MRNLLTSTILALAALAVVPGLRAQDGRPDFTGTWSRINSPDSNSDNFTFKEPPLTPWAEKRYRAARKGVEGFDQARLDLDQMTWPYCQMPGIPRAYLRPGPIEVIQTAKGLYIIFESNKAARQIYLDGRKHPDGAPPSFMGHSIGRWDGNTLLAETVNIHKYTWIDGMGTPHTEALRIEERFRRVNPTRMEIDFVFHDPGAFTQAWGGKKEFDLRNDWELMEYGVCIDQSLEEYDKLWQKEIGEPY